MITVMRILSHGQTMYYRPMTEESMGKHQGEVLVLRIQHGHVKLGKLSVDVNMEFTMCKRVEGVSVKCWYLRAPWKHSL